MVFCEFILVVEKGFVEFMVNGVFVGYLMVDVKVKFYDGLYYDVDLFEIVFKIVVLFVFKEVVKLV